MWLQKNKGLLASFLVGLILLCVPSTASANSNIETKICPSFEGPTITVPSTGTETENSSITIGGVGEPGMAISIVRNGVIIGMTTAVADGSYGLEVGLESGDNALLAREINECGTVKDSEAVSVHRTVVESPQTPTTPDEEDTSVIPQADVETQPSVGIGEGTPPLLQLPIVPTVDTPGFLKPTITTPSSGDILNSSQVWVGGRAHPGSVVTIYLNGRSVAYVIATEKGVYGTLVSLSKGKNALQVRSTLGTNVATSDVIEVLFEQDETLTPVTQTTPLIDGVAVQVGIVITASVAVVGTAFWAIPELRHISKLRWFK